MMRADEAGTNDVHVYYEMRRSLAQDVTLSSDEPELRLIT